MRNLDIYSLCCQFQSLLKHNKFHKLNRITSKHFGKSACLGHLKGGLNIKKNYFTLLCNAKLKFNSSYKLCNEIKYHSIPSYTKIEKKYM